ncbi:MAG: 50S ribosomal protein L22 [Nitrospinae bacterium]|nr:50S ribosomal protein L22 [Nitrospinota bacterium]
MEAIEASATLRFTRVSAQKARLAADMIRGKSVADAKSLLSFSPQKSAALLLKLLDSAVANAENNKKVEDIDVLEVWRVWVNQGPALRRQIQRARGRADVIRRPTAHMTIVVRENLKAKEEARAKLEAMKAKKAAKKVKKEAAPKAPKAAKAPKAEEPAAAEAKPKKPRKKKES